MPYRDRKKRLESNRRWKAKNKEKVKGYQKKGYQAAYRNKEYTSLINDIQKLSYEDQKKYLLSLLGARRGAILRRMNNLKLKQDIQKTLHEKNLKNANDKLNKKWEYVKEWMIDRGCDCGENNITKLSFHHLDPLEKNSTIRKYCNNSIEKVKEELKKGVVKCKNCHTIIHAGTSIEREEALINQYLKKSVNKRYRYERKNKLLIWELKRTLSCIKCGVNDPVILLFHHIDNKSKNEKICLMYKTSRGVINKELAKTVCLCHNCHEDFHYIYSQKDNTQTQLEQYIDKKVIHIKVDIRDYLPIIDQNISQFYNLSFSIT